ncbi:hypothetical protein T07_9038 [Trichinella nelsoni]|uniref:Uncharacterized protein n=1 Tax=Trichinella nelsoni TaxID=6336 RepID=A0A0V0RBT3_9BILA|nr:hypothetical protein T07_9038 [Trichinella nelsoni]
MAVGYFCQLAPSYLRLVLSIANAHSLATCFLLDCER